MRPQSAAPVAAAAVQTTRKMLRPRVQFMIMEA